jgi:hypothetical protein
MKNKRILQLLILPFMLSGCSKKALDPIPFNLNVLDESFSVERGYLLKSTTEFSDFLNNSAIFTNKPSDKFKEINAKYNQDYFNNNDLGAVIVQATSSMIYGYSLNEIRKQENSWIISLRSLSEKENVTCDMGAFYCYYFELEKDINITKVTVVRE